MAGQLTQFLNCRILRDHKIIKEDIWIRNGKICDPEKIFFDEQIKADIQVNCEGRLIVPGFIELQINGGKGYDFSFNDKTEEGINVVAVSLLSQGVTSFCPTLVTSPREIYHKVLPKIRPRKGDKNGATILGTHLEGPFINKEKKGAHPENCILDYEQGMSKLIDVYGSLDGVKIITIAPEFQNSSAVIMQLYEKGITVSLGHSAANLSEGEQAVKDGAHLITHLFNAMLPFHHRDPGLVGLLTSERISCKTVYFGIIADGTHTHPAALRIAYRVHPKGLVLVTDAVSATGLDEGSYKIGQMDVEIRNGKAYVAGTTTLCGSIATMIQCVRNLICFTGCPPEYAFEAASLHPAKALGIEDTKGTLNFGADADFVMLTNNYRIHSTYIAGEMVYENKC